jgi:hypothetical protein
MPIHDTRAPAKAVAGPIGRVFNRIAGKADNNTDSAGMAFTRDQLKAYLDKRIGLAEGEFFRGAKLDGVAEALVAKLDQDKDGAVTWEEFQAFEEQTLAAIAPGSQRGDDPAAVSAAATTRFGQMDSSRDGKVAFGELQTGTEAALPANTDHKDLVAQLGARIALDAADQDEQAKAVKDRSLTGGEWTQAAVAMASRR